MVQNYFSNKMKKLQKVKKYVNGIHILLPVIAETSGIVNYMDLVDGVSLSRNYR